jgi:hypothetical protein
MMGEACYDATNITRGMSVNMLFLVQDLSERRLRAISRQNGSAVAWLADRLDCLRAGDG